MIFPVTLPLSFIPAATLQILAEAGKPEALNQAIAEFNASEAGALAHANDLLNDGYTLLFRERVTTDQGESLILYFYKAPVPIETPEQTAIKEAYRIYQSPPKQGGGGEHPDSLRLNGLIKVLIKSGILPDDTPPVSDDTQVDVTPHTLEAGT